MKKIWYMLPLLAATLSSCDISRAMQCNQEAIEMSTEAIYENIEAIEQSNRAIAENKRKLDEINQTLSKVRAE